jgi:hypothetical protein
VSETIEYEYDGLGTVGELRQQIASMPDDLPLRDCFGEPLLLQIITDTETADKHVTIR